MSATQITASRTNRSLVNQAPDRAADLKVRRIVLANPVLLGYRRILDTTFAEASKTKEGLPTDGALAALTWIMERGVRPAPADVRDETEWGVYATSLEGVCEMLGLTPSTERKRMLTGVKAAYAEAAVKQIQSYVNGRLSAVLTCAGLPSLQGQQYVLGLVSTDDYEDIAWVERVDPPARPKRSKHKRMAEAA